MSVLKIHMTYQCTAECNHCRFRCSSLPTPVIDFDIAMDAVQTLEKYHDLQLVVLMGGEPSLFPKLAHELTAAIRRLGLGVRVETNASWATTEERAHRFLEPLYTSGASVMFSLDSFHEPYVPLSSVECAVRASDRLGGAYCLEMAYLSSDRADPRDVRSDQLLEELERRLGRSPVCDGIYKGVLLFNGRAADTLAEKAAAGRGVPTETCESAPWWHNGSLHSLELLMLDADGFLSKGCGIAIGNLTQTSTKNVLESYNAEKHLVFSVLIESGPLGLARRAEAPGYRLKDNYADKCHLCQEAREVLRSKYPQYLQPDQHYRQSATRDLDTT